MRITVTSTLGDLERDLRTMAVQAKPAMARVVRKTAERGNRLAKGFAKQSAGAHGKHYHKAFSAEAVTPLTWTYGPDASMPQGGMSFERGSRNQPYHGDLDKSADIVGPELHTGVQRLLDDLFWPGA